AFYRTGAAYQTDLLVAADFYTSDCHCRGAASNFIRSERVRFLYRNDCFYSRHCGERFFANAIFRADYANDHSGSATTDLSVETELAHTRDDTFDLLLHGIRLCDDNHGASARQ